LKASRYTNTFADYFVEPHPERECYYNFPNWSVERYPTEEEKKEDPNVYLIIENQVFFYRPFVMVDAETGERRRF